MWPEKGHKKEATADNPMGGCMLCKRLLQGNNQANSVMLQETVNKMELKFFELERYTDRQQNTVNKLVDKVNTTQAFAAEATDLFPD